MPAEAIPKINLIPLSEVNEREAKYLLRLADVTTSGELVKSMSNFPSRYHVY